MEGIEKGWKGINNAILTNWNTTAVCAIDDGSLFEVSGAIYLATTDTSISGAVTTGLNYIEAVGSAIGCVFNWTQNSPVWRNDLNGWYSSAASTIRTLGGCFSDGASYCGKFLYKDYDNPIKWFSALHGGHTSSTDITQSNTSRVTWAGAGYLMHAVTIPDNSFITRTRVVGILGTGTTFAIALYEDSTTGTAITHCTLATTTAGVFDMTANVTSTNCTIDSEHNSMHIMANVATYSVTSSVYYLGCQYIQRDHQ
jgi:hypothetical protein